MRTPNEVFKDMCPEHGEAWGLIGDTWHCIRKDANGNRYEDSSKSVPLPVAEMAMATGLTWIFFHSLTGEVEPLVTREQKNKILASRTKQQIDREAKRVEEMHSEQRREVRSLIKHVIGKLGGTVELAGVIDFGKPQEKPVNKKEELN